MAEPALPPMAVTVDFNKPLLDLSNLKGRSVLITGAASGIGLACATKMAEAGAIVTLSDLQEATGQTIVQELQSKGCKVQFVQCDVASYTAQVEMFQRAVQFGGGKLDIVVPNAGIIGEHNLFDLVPAETPSLDSPPPPEPGYAGLKVNLHGVYNTCYLAIHYFRLPRDVSDTFKPAIVLIASLAGYLGYPSGSTYSMSKFGVRGLFYSIRDRATRATPAVRVNLIAPWYIDTAMTGTPEFRNGEAAAMLHYTGFAPMERVVDAVVRFSADERLQGRAAGIFPLANEDLGDDLEGAFAGVVLQKHMGLVRQMVVKGMAEQGTQKNELSRQDSAIAGQTVR
jgi:5'-hydroxyaverantin dehydrogenase